MGAYDGGMSTGPDPRIRAALRALQAFTVEAERYMEVSRRREGMGHNDVHAISAISMAADSGSPMTPGRLAKRLVLSPAATTALLDRLERHNLIERIPVAHDGRTTWLQPTPKCREMGRDMFRQLSISLGARLEQLDDTEMDLLMRVMAELTDGAADARRALEDGAENANAVDDRGVVARPEVVGGR